MTDTGTIQKQPRGRRKPGTAGTAPAAPTPTRTRRRPLMVAAGLALAVVCGLGAWFLFSTVGTTVTVLTVRDEVPRGEPIVAEDLTTLQIASGQTTNALPAARAREVIGQIAMVDLPAGTVVTSANIGDTLTVAGGDSIVGVALTTAQMPSQQLAAGDVVRLVDTPIAQGEPPATPPQTFTATVFAVRPDEQNSRLIVDLVVNRSEAPDIAARAATGRVALILDSGE